MKRIRSELLLAGLFTSVPIASLAQSAPVVVEAESGALGSSLTTATAGGVTYITTTENSAATPTPSRTATYTVSFPAAGTYDLYVRILVGPNPGNDDSFYIANGFDTSTNWSAAYNTSSGGHTNPNDTVLTGGGAGQNVYKWVRLTGADGIGPAGWVVPAGSLTQSFSWGSREDGLLFDKLAFGVQGVCYRVSDLDNGTNATGTCPPPPPPDPPPYTRTAPPIAAGNAKYLGAAWSPGTASLNFANYWNQITPENGGKWGTVEGTRDVMNWAQADEAYALAKAQGFKFKWHTLVWGSQQPGWIAALPPADQLEEIREWYAAIAARYPDIDQIDVVNEPLHAPPPYLNALGGAGTSGWDWVITSFQMAREYFPRAELLINDYSITNDGNATTRYLQIIQLLKDRGLIDGIGDQVHAFSTTEPAPMPNHKANLDRLAATGLPIYGSEFDLDGVAFGQINNEVQLANYQRVFPVFWEHPAVKGITIWGYVRGFHWRNSQGDWLLYPNGGERPALQWLINYVQDAPPIVKTRFLDPDENLLGLAAVGTLNGWDTDPGTTFSQWQLLADPSGRFTVDPDTGLVRLTAEGTLDFETLPIHTITVSVWDGYKRSPPTQVEIRIANLNDNAPEVLAGQAFDIDAGDRYDLGLLKAADADDTNQPGFTTFSGWKVVGGSGASVFAIDPVTGLLSVRRPLMIDFRRSSYSVLATVSDGKYSSAAREISIAIPSKLTVCLLSHVQLEVPKLAAGALLRAGAALGACN
jgi:endo-1,4-beta-xylanase